VIPTGHNLAPNGVNQTVRPDVREDRGMSLPGWVWVPATRLKTHWALHGDTGLADFPEYDWKVHPDGTKAVRRRVREAGHRVDPAFTTGGAISAANTYYTLYTGMAKRALGSNTAGTRGTCAPGLIEVAITIAITGPNPQDFTLTVTPTTLRDPAATDYCTLFAGYLSDQDIAGAGSRGDLCVWDVERYYRMPTRARCRTIGTAPARQ
jgi:hypothetical protein